MPDHRHPHPGEDPDGAAPGPRSGMADVSGRAVQARDVQGGVHFHGHGQYQGPSRAPVPRQLPGDVHGFVNRLGETEVLSTHVRREKSDDGPEAPIHVVTGTAGVGRTALALEGFTDPQAVRLRGEINARAGGTGF